MIRIKNYIFNENDLINIIKIGDRLRINLKSSSEYVYIDAEIEDIEWNYENNISESLSYDLAKAKIEELEEENQKLKKELEIEINNSNIMSAQIKDKKIKIEQLNERIDKAIEYIENKEINYATFNSKDLLDTGVGYDLWEILKGE